MDPGHEILERLQKEVSYYKAQMDATSGVVLSMEYKLAEMSNKVSQLQKGLGLIKALQDAPAGNDLTRIYDHFTEQVNLQLLMDRSLMLFPVTENRFCPAHVKGYSAYDAVALLEQHIYIPEPFLSQKKSLLVNSQTERSVFIDELSLTLQLQYFILTPILVQDEIMAFLVTGRRVERMPLASSRLLVHDVHALEAIAGVIAAIRNQYDRFLLLEGERVRIAREMHDEIGSGLTHISMISDGLRFNGGDRWEEDSAKLSAASRELIQNMGEIIWSLNPAHDTLGSLLIYLREQINKFLEPSGIDYSIGFPESIPHMVLTNAQRRNIYLTVKEAINNTVKYAKAERLCILVAIESSVLRLEIRDNGCGFSPDEVRRTANGMKNMRKRMEEIGGILEISSELGVGTSMLCTLGLQAAVDAGGAMRGNTTTTFM